MTLFLEISLLRRVELLFIVNYVLFPTCDFQRLLLATFFEYPLYIYARFCIYLFDYFLVVWEKDRTLN